MKKCLNILTVMVSAAFVLSLSACSPNLSANTARSSEVGVASNTLPGTIINKRIVSINNNSGIGGAAGATTGAVAGSAIGGGTRVPIIGAVGGAVVGGLLGNAVDKSIHSQSGYEYVVKLKNGKLVSVIQTQDSDFSVGQRVFVIYGGRTHLIAR